MSDEAPEVAVTRSGDRDRYEITVDDQQAGFAEYVDRDGQRIFHHTEIGEDFGGRGLGSTLIGRALADTRAAGLRVVPVCPFVAKYLTSPVTTTSTTSSTRSPRRRSPRCVNGPDEPMSAPGHPIHRRHGIEWPGP